MQRGVAVWSAVGFLLVGLAGCLSDDPVDEAAQGANDALAPWIDPIILGHDHADPMAHDLANNMELVGFHPLGDDASPWRSISEIDVAGDHAFVGLMGYGFAIVDLTDPTQPNLTATVEVTSPDRLSPLGAYIADLKVDAEGNWVFVALELSTTPGVLIYDARDKANPTLAGFWPEPGLLLGCHMIEYAIINEQEYLFCAPLDNAVYVGRLLPATGGIREVVQVARWMPTSPQFIGQQGEAAQTYIENGDPIGAGLHFVSGHQDMTHQVDPLTGADILTVSFWNLGLHFVDVSLPEVPVEMGSWAGEQADKWDGVLHTSMVFESEGRRIAVTTPEGARPPAMFILDATDYDDPQVLSQWMAAPDFEGEDGAFSLHNFQIVGGKIYLAHYHGGLWVLDVSTPELQADPKPLGTYLPWDRETGRGCCGGSWDVVVYNGYVISANTGGLYVTHLTGDPAGDDTYSSGA
ncbi:MAG: LVIVD repeat-containing protein [Thermoplasmatota archaeon]